LEFFSIVCNTIFQAICIANACPPPHEEFSSQPCYYAIISSVYGPNDIFIVLSLNCIYSDNYCCRAMLPKCAVFATTNRPSVCQQSAYPPLWRRGTWSHTVYVRILRK